MKHEQFINDLRQLLEKHNAVIEAENDCMTVFFCDKEEKEPCLELGNYFSPSCGKVG